MAFWRSLTCPIQELRLDLTLVCGQSFRWLETSPGVWTSVIGGHVCSLRQDGNTLFYLLHPNSKVAKHGRNNAIGDDGGASICECANPGTELKSTETGPITIYSGVEPDVKKNRLSGLECVPSFSGCSFHEKYDSILRDYFQLDISLVDLYEHWCKVDGHFKSLASQFPGIRILRQNPVENLFSFICSSNNHISRISGMVEKLCLHYGDQVGSVDDKVWHSFPPIERLAADNVEQRLRELGFGYRAKYISQTARYINQHHDEAWLTSLRQLPYPQAKLELMKLCGVGAKVADCVCLMSLDKHGAIPVDTHVWQIACRDYLPSLKSVKSVTETVYKQIGDHFRELWGDHAGWAQSVLFSADLKKFQELKKNDRHLKDAKKDVAEKPKGKITEQPSKAKKKRKQ